MREILERAIEDVNARIDEVTRLIGQVPEDQFTPAVTDPAVNALLLLTRSLGATKLQYLEQLDAVIDLLDADEADENLSDKRCDDPDCDVCTFLRKD